MLSFKNFLNLFEGGNVKIGDVSANDLNVTTKNREHHQKDIHGMLSDLHDSFYKDQGEHLFGKGKKALNNHSVYSGSTKHLMGNEISHDEFSKHKPSVGDIDVKVPKEHMDKLHQHLQPGKRFGNYTVVGVKKGGGEHHALMKHDNGSVHQVDFEGVNYEHGEPSKFDHFAHSSDWEDTKKGIKGAHHKQLLNAIGTDKHKFSILHGLSKREGEPDWEKDTHKITHKLFGKNANESHVHSFHGLTNLIKNHIPAEHHQAIYNKFKTDVAKNKKVNSGPALEHLKKHLNVKDNINEESDSSEHHTSVIPMTGFVPVSHMGHAKDLGGTLSKMPGTKHVGISGKSDAYSQKERQDILQRQWGKGVTAHGVTGAGETIRKAHDSLPEKGKKVLHLLVGHDRKSFAEGLKKSLEAGKIKEMGDKKFDEIHIQHPEDTDRSHGMSGTKMRSAALAGDINEFHKHLGPMFSRKEATEHMNRIKKGIEDGTIPLKRK